MKKKRIWIYMAAALSILLLLGGCSSKSSRISAGTAAVETTTDSLPEDSIFLMDKNTVFERAEATGEWLFTAIGVESRKQDQEADMTGMENNDNKKVAMRVRSLPEAFPVVGKRLEDLGFTREDLESEMYLLIETEFLGEMTEIMGLTEMWNDNLIKELTFYGEQPFDEAKAYFTDLYGEPFRKGWEPYIVSQGGVVDWFMYWTGEGIVQLRKGQNFNWFECKYEIPEEKPEEILKQEAGLTLQEFAWSSGYYMNDLTEEDFDYLKIEKKEEDHLTWDFIYQGTECHFDLYRKKGPQLADYMSGVSYETSRVGDWEEVHTCVKDGWGEQIWVNPVKDIWRLEIRKEATAEKLNAIRELLETHSWRYDPSKKE